MLANGRPEMCIRAIRSFQAQSYESRQLLIWDSSGRNLPYDMYPRLRPQIDADDRAVIAYALNPDTTGRKSIGALRNEALETADTAGIPYDLVAHWDSDDWSASGRLTDQVHAITRDYEATGYNTMTFWREPENGRPGEAWRYSSQDAQYCIGTSLMYWRDTWKAKPFPDMPIKGEPRVSGAEELGWQLSMKRWSSPGTVFMIASVHTDNTLCKIAAGMKEWNRQPELDKWAAERMRL